MINYRKIKGRITELGMTIGDVASSMNPKKTPYTLGQKLNNKSPMTLDEMDQIARICKISVSEIPSFFMWNGCEICNQKSRR